MVSNDNLFYFWGQSVNSPKRDLKNAATSFCSRTKPPSAQTALPPPLIYFCSAFRRNRYKKTLKMESLLRYVRVPPNSASMDEARRHVFEFFKTACRSIPRIMDVYNLDDVVTPSQLRSTVSSMIRKNAHITNPKVCSNL